MNRLPIERRLINGRTYSTSWNPASMDPIQRFPSRASNWASAALAAAIGAGFVYVLVLWIDWSLA